LGVLTSLAWKSLPNQWCILIINWTGVVWHPCTIMYTYTWKLISLINTASDNHYVLRHPWWNAGMWTTRPRQAHSRWSTRPPIHGWWSHGSDSSTKNGCCKTCVYHIWHDSKELRSKSAYWSPSSRHRHQHTGISTQASGKAVTIKIEQHFDEAAEPASSQA
jgi:hypothetical protein